MSKAHIDPRLAFPGNSEADLLDQLSYLIGETGEILDVDGMSEATEAEPGKLRIRVFHARAFPWDDVFKALVYRGYEASVGADHADLFIDAVNPAL